jgi:hypothetical protein
VRGTLGEIMIEETPLDPKAPDRLRIGTCRAVLEWVFENIEGWTAGKSKDGADLILVSIFARSARTYEAIVRCLGERGFGEQGLMLNRSLFEDMIDARWVSLNRDLAVQRLHQHDLYSRLLRADAQRKYADWFDGRKPPAIKVSNEERKELRVLFGKSGSGSWTGVHSLDDRVDSVKACWGPEGQKALLFWHDWVQKLMNEVLHPSAFSLGRLGAPTVHRDDDDRESFEWHFGSTREWLGAPCTPHTGLSSSPCLCSSMSFTPRVGVNSTSGTPRRTKPFVMRITGRRQVALRPRRRMLRCQCQILPLTVSR